MVDRLLLAFPSLSFPGAGGFLRYVFLLLLWQKRADLSAGMWRYTFEGSLNVRGKVGQGLYGVAAVKKVFSN